MNEREIGRYELAPYSLPSLSDINEQTLPGFHYLFYTETKNESLRWTLQGSHTDSN